MKKLLILATAIAILFSIQNVNAQNEADFDSFWNSFKQALISKNIQSLSDMVAYPFPGESLMYFIDDVKVPEFINNKDEFLKYFPLFYKNGNYLIKKLKLKPNKYRKFYTNKDDYNEQTKEGQIWQHFLEIDSEEGYESSTTFIFEYINGGFKLTSIMLAG